MAKQIPSLMDRFYPQNDWRNTNSYPPDELTRCWWAWQFLRRNKAYIKAYHDAFLAEIKPADPGRTAPAPELSLPDRRWDPTFLTFDTRLMPSPPEVFMEKFGIPILLNPRVEEPSRFKSSYDKLRTVRTGPSLRNRQLKNSEFLALFDTRLPFKAQVEIFEKEFNRKKKHGLSLSHLAKRVEASKDEFPCAPGGYEDEFEEVLLSRQHHKPQRYRQLLQVLDAQHAGAKRKDVHAFMGPKRRGTTDEPADLDEWWANTTKIAHEYRDSRFKDFYW